MGFIKIPTGTKELRMSDGNWVNVPSGVTEVDESMLFSEAEEVAPQKPTPLEPEPVAEQKPFSISEPDTIVSQDSMATMTPEEMQYSADVVKQRPTLKEIAVGTGEEYESPTAPSGNTLAGVVNRTNQLTGNIAKMGQHIVDEVVGKDSPQNTQFFKKANDFIYENNKMDYKPTHTWEETKKAFKAGGVFDVDSWQEVGNYVAEQGIKSIPDMGYMITQLPLYFFSRTQEMADERAVNEGREKPTNKDYAISAPFVAGSIVLDRLGLKAMTTDAIKTVGKDALSKNLKTTIKNIGSATRSGAIKEGGTEFIQEGIIEPLGETIGTKEGAQIDLERGVAGAVAGAGMGGPVAGAVSTVSEAVTPRVEPTLEEPTAEAPTIAQPEVLDAENQKLQDLLDKNIISTVEENIPDATPEEKADIIQRVQGKLREKKAEALKAAGTVTPKVEEKITIEEPTIEAPKEVEPIAKEPEVIKPKKDVTEELQKEYDSLKDIDEPTMDEQDRIWELEDELNIKEEIEIELEKGVQELAPKEKKAYDKSTEKMEAEVKIKKEAKKEPKAIKTEEKKAKYKEDKKGNFVKHGTSNYFFKDDGSIELHGKKGVTVVEDSKYKDMLITKYASEENIEKANVAHTVSFQTKTIEELLKINKPLGINSDGNIVAEMKEGKKVVIYPDTKTALIRRSKNPLTENKVFKVIAPYEAKKAEAVEKKPKETIKERIHRRAEEIKKEAPTHRTRYLDEEKAKKEIEDKKIPTALQGLENDITYEEAYRSRAGISHIPEERARQIIAGHKSYMESNYNELKELAKTPEQQEFLDTEFKRFRDAYVKKQKDVLAKDSRTLSAMITGPARFPTASNQKKVDTAMKASMALSEFSEKVLNKIKSTLRGTDVIKSTDENAIEKLKEKLSKLEQNQEMMKNANRVLKSKKLTQDQKIKELTKLGLEEKNAKELFKPDFAGNKGYASFQLTNNNAKIKSTKLRIADLEKMKELADKPQEEPIKFNGGELVQDYTDQRIRFMFDEKPDAETITMLKKRGFRWSPKNGAWQTQLTQNGQSRARQILSELRAKETDVEAKPEIKTRAISDSRKSKKLSARAEEIQEAKEPEIGGSEEEAKAKVKQLFRKSIDPMSKYKDMSKEDIEEVDRMFRNDRYTKKDWNNAYDALETLETKRKGTQAGLDIEGTQKPLFDTTEETRLVVPKWAKPLVSDTTRYEDIVSAVTEAKKGNVSELALRAFDALEQQGLFASEELEKEGSVLFANPIGKIAKYFLIDIPQVITDAVNVMNKISFKYVTGKVKDTKFDDWVRKHGGSSTGLGQLSRQEEAIFKKKYYKLQSAYAKADIKADEKIEVLKEIQGTLKEELFNKAVIRYLENPLFREDMKRDFPEIAIELDKVRKLIDALSEEAMQRGLLTPSQFYKWQGRYLSRIYQIEANVKGVNITSGIKQYEIKKNRKIESIIDYLEDNKKEADRLNAVLDPKAMLRETIVKTQSNIGLDDFYRGIIEQGGLVDDNMLIKLDESINNLPDRFSPAFAKKVVIPYLKDLRTRLENKEEFSELDSMFQTSKDVDKINKTISSIEARAEEAQYYIDSVEDTEKALLPKDQRYGVLSGLPVTSDVASLVKSTFNMSASPEMLADKLDTIGGTALTLFKWLKVPANIFAYPRNYMSNYFQWMLSGANMSPASFSTETAKATFSMIKKDKWFKIAREHGMFGKNMTNEELNSYIERIESESKTALAKGGAKFMKNIGNAYGWIDDMVKVARMRYAIEHEGMTPLDAVFKAQETHFDYSLTYDLVRAMRSPDLSRGIITKLLGNLFPTFTQKVIAFMYDTVIHRPATLAMLSVAMLSMYSSIDDDNEELLGTKEWEKLKKTFPEWVKSNPLVVAKVEKKGEIVTVTFTDVSYIVPFGVLLTAANHMLHGDIGKAGGAAGLGGNPLQSLRDISSNVDNFTGSQIYYEYNKLEMAKDLLKYTGKMVAPGTITKLINIYESKHPLIGRVIGINQYKYDARELKFAHTIRSKQAVLDASRRARKYLRKIVQARKDFKEGKINQQKLNKITEQNKQDIKRWTEIGVNAFKAEIGK